jgi:myo-inositol 2-dehydrogenase/D-chiro-inositol 1-dehydrogenase
MVGRRPASSTGESSPMPTSAKITGAVLGLAVHNLPLVRHFAPEIETIDAARWLDPFGYVITMRGGGRAIELVGYMHKQWRPEWTFDAYSDEASLHVDFTPSYVQAGSATATFATSAGRQSWGPYDSNGYEAEWLHLAELARGESEPRHALSSLIDDVGYAIDIADAAAAAVEKGMAA